MSKSGGELSGTPREIKDIIFEILPWISQIFGNVKLFVNFTRFIIIEVLARSPASCKSPWSLLRMVMELMNSLSRVKSSQVSTAIFGDPVDTVGSCENNQVVIYWALHQILNFSNFSLSFIKDASAWLVHHWMELFPRIAPVSGPIDSSHFCLNQDDIIGVAAP